MFLTRVLRQRLCLFILDKYVTGLQSVLWAILDVLRLESQSSENLHYITHKEAKRFFVGCFKLPFFEVTLHRTESF